MTGQRRDFCRLLAVGLIACFWALGCQGDGSRRAAQGEEGRRAPRARSTRTTHEGVAHTQLPAQSPEAPARGALEGVNGGGDPADESAAEATEPAEADVAPADEPAEEPAAQEEEKPAPVPAPVPAPAARKQPKADPAKAGGKPRSAAEALAVLKEDSKLKTAESEYHVQQGDEAYQQLDYKTAMDAYRKALNINPALSEVRERWARCGLVLGTRNAEILAVRQEFVEADRVRKAQRLADAKLGLQEGKDLLDSGDFRNAEHKLRKVYEELLWFEYPVDITALRAEVKDQIGRIDGLKKKTAKEQRQVLEENVSQKMKDEVDREKKVREQQVRELVRKAADYVRLKDFEKGIETCKRILTLKPDHRVARFWLRDMESQHMDQRRARIHLEQAENTRLMQQSIAESAVSHTEIFVFPGEKEWNSVRKRQETLEVVALDDPEWIRKIKNALEQKMTFSFEQRPLKDVLPFLSEQIGINVVSDTAINTEEILIDLSAKEMKALDALNQIMTLTGLAYTFKENTLFITEKDKAKGDTKFAIYNVSDIMNKIRNFEGPEMKLKMKDDTSSGGAGASSSLTFSTGTAEEGSVLDPTALIELIQEGSGGTEVWGEQNTIEFHKGQLFVNATKELHQQIQNTLKNLREDSDLFVVIEARFIDINDDFLEDIGIDSRALGVGSNWGTPYGNVINNSSTGGNDLGFVKQGSPVRDVTLIMGQDRYAGRVQHILDGFTGLLQGNTLKGGPSGIGGLTAQATWLEPFQINVILRAVQEKSDVRQLTAPIITAHNGQRVYVSVVTQRAYIADYELVSGGTGFSIIEVADPVVQTFQEGVILDVNPVIAPDKKYVTLDVRPTMASLIGGIISTIHISLGSFTNVAFQVPIGIPEIALQQSFTSVTVPNGGTVLLGGFKSLSDQRFLSYLPILGRLPIIGNLFRRKAQLIEKRSLVILITARIVDLRADERTRFNE